MSCSYISIQCILYPANESFKSVSHPAKHYRIWPWLPLLPAVSLSMTSPQHQWPLWFLKPVTTLSCDHTECPWVSGSLHLLFPLSEYTCPWCLSDLLSYFSHESSQISPKTLEKSLQTMLTKMTLPSSIFFSSFTFLYKLNHTYTLTLFYIHTDLNIDYIFVEGRDSVYHCVPQA